MDEDLRKSTRKIVTRSPSRTVRIINLPGLLPQSVEAESTLEAHFVRRAAFLPGTIDLIHQPFILPTSERGYTPDFLHAQDEEVPSVVEVKPLKKLKKYQQLFDRTAEFLASKGYGFYVVTDSDLERSGIHERTLMLRRYAKGGYPQCECSRTNRHSL